MASHPQGFSGLMSNPMFGLGIGLLGGASPGGTFGSGAQQGLQNMMMMQAQNQRNSLQDLQMNKVKADLAEQERMRTLQETMRAQTPDWLGSPAQAAQSAPYMQSNAELFPGEQPIGGLMEQTPATPASGMYQQSPQMAGLMSDMYQADPLGTTKSIATSLMAQQSSQAESATKQAYALAMEDYKRGKPMVIGKGGRVYIPGQGFIGPDGGEVKPELSDVLGLKKQAQPRMDMFRKVAQSGENILANITREGAFSDVNTLVSAIKVLDPESVVREGEVALPINVSGLWNAIQSKVQQAKGDGFLTPTLRKDIAGSVNALLRTYEKAYADVANEYDSFSTEYNIDSQKIIGNKITFPVIDENMWDSPQVTSSDLDNLPYRPSYSPPNASGKIQR